MITNLSNFFLSIKLKVSSTGEPSQLAETASSAGDEDDPSEINEPLVPDEPDADQPIELSVNSSRRRRDSPALEPDDPAAMANAEDDEEHLCHTEPICQIREEPALGMTNLTAAAVAASVIQNAQQIRGGNNNNNNNHLDSAQERRERRFACPFCGKCVRSKENLKLHVRKHTGERPFVCLFCGRAFGGKSDLTRHLRIHTGERPYHCEMCGKCFARADYLSKHLTTHIHQR